MEKKKAAKLSAAQKSPVSKVWLCKFALFHSCFGRVRRANRRKFAVDSQEEEMDREGMDCCEEGEREGEAVFTRGVEGYMGHFCCWKDDANISRFTDMLLFVICGGLIFEALRLVFGFFG
jgi:hypothetical protein